MQSHYRVVIVGGGVVGASVLYHLAKLGWTDVALVERSVLTAGSSWHAAGGVHALNADPNMAALQAYTIDLLSEIEKESGQDIELHMTGGITVASAPARWEWLQSAYRIFQTIGIEDCHLMTPEEIREKCPIMDVTGVIGGLWADREGYLDTTGTVHAYAGAARKRGAEVIEHNKVEALNPRADGTWEVVTEKGVIHAEHVVNAGGLWAKQVGRMVGLDLPLSPLQHHYFVTETIPEVAALDFEVPMTVDLEGFTYIRQDQQGVLVGIYEVDHKHWNIDGAPWDYGFDLIPEEIDRIAGELLMAWQRYPVLERVGVKRWVNGAFTFSPDGNPLVGPVRGLHNYWLACGVMAGFLQGGGVGKSLAEWMNPRRGGGRRVADGHRALRALHLEPGVHPADHRAVLLAPLRDDLSERAASRRKAAAQVSGPRRHERRRLPLGAAPGGWRPRCCSRRRASRKRRR